MIASIFDKGNDYDLVGIHWLAGIPQIGTFIQTIETDGGVTRGVRWEVLEVVLHAFPVLHHTDGKPEAWINVKRDE